MLTSSTWHPKSHCDLEEINNEALQRDRKPPEEHFTLEKPYLALSQHPIRQLELSANKRATSLLFPRPPWGSLAEDLLMFDSFMLQLKKHAKQSNDKQCFLLTCIFSQSIMPSAKLEDWIPQSLDPMLYQFPNHVEEWDKSLILKLRGDMKRSNLYNSTLQPEKREVFYPLSPITVV